MPRIDPELDRRRRAGATLTRRVLLCGALAAALPAALHAAEAWPTKPVRIIVPFAPGGGSDISARALAEILAPQLGQPMVVENKPGAGSALGVTAAAQSRDGHTLLMGSNSMVINPILRPGMSYDVARDFDAVGMVSGQPLVLVVPASSRVQSVADLVADAKARPGQVSAGNSGKGTLAHLTAVLFELQTGTELIAVPYKGESALMPDVISGQVAMGFLNLPSVLPHVRAGRLRALAVSSPHPHPDLPGVTTLRALGFPDLEVQGWAALLAPKGTIPPEAVARLSELLAKAVTSEAITARFASMGLTALPSTPAAATRHLEQEAARWTKVIQARGIKAD